LERFLANPRIAWQSGCQCWAKWVLSTLAGQTIILLVDETKLGDHLSIMVVGLAYRACCIPLAFWCYLPKQWPRPQVELIDELLSWVLPAIPAGVIPLVEADRGIGTSPELIRKIEQRGWRYLFRVQNSTKVLTRSGQWQTISHLVKPGECWSGWGVAFKKRGQLRAYVQVIWEVGYDTPWCLVTNAEQVKGMWYAVRYWQEAGFRDLKSDGWQWQGSRVWNADHAHRLVLVLALAYAWTVTLGTWASDDPQQREIVTKGQKRQSYSLFRLGLRYWEYLVAQARDFWTGLALTPPLPIPPPISVGE
jgi:hypothetical protein